MVALGILVLVAAFALGVVVGVFGTLLYIMDSWSW